MIALNNEDDYDWLVMARDHGSTKGTAQRYQGKNPVYDVMFPGYRLKSDDMHAAIGIEQLKKLPAMTKRRNELVARYNKNLGYNRTGKLQEEARKESKKKNKKVKQSLKKRKRTKRIKIQICFYGIP